ncbi:hypothetical protein NFI96_025802, partial [Prochilodus magdalenae]
RGAASSTSAAAESQTVTEEHQAPQASETAVTESRELSEGALRNEECWGADSVPPWSSFRLSVVCVWKFDVVGPANPVVATAGSDTILPCSIQREDQTPLGAVDLNITWSRPDLGDALVHFYADQRDINTRQIVMYTVIGTRPVITVEKYDESSDTFTLLCESGGWRPEPDLQWLDSEGKILMTGVTESDRDAELFSVKRQVTVSYRDTDTAYCKVTLGQHTMEKPITPSILRGNGEYYLDFNNASLHLRHKISNPPRSNITKDAEVGVISYGISSVHI